MNKIFLVIVMLLFSCRNNNKVLKLYYEDNKTIKSEVSFTVVNDTYIRNGEAKSYYSNGSLKVILHYLNDTLNGVFKKFNEDASLKSEGYYWRNVKVGPIKYYKNGVIEYFNESDYYGNTYYVQKYGVNKNIIKEDGLAISPVSYMVPDTNHIMLNSTVSLYFFYAEPDGYRNSLKALVNDTLVEMNILPSHIASVTKKIIKPGKNVIKIFSVLKKNDNIISQDSCMKELFSY